MTDSDSELRELMAEVPDEFLLRTAFNGLSMATEMRFDPSKRVTNRLCCLVALFCLERLLDLPELPNVGPIEAAE